MAKEVGLTAAQITRINKLYELRQKQIQPKLDEYNQLKTDLDRMFRDHTVDPAEVEAQARRMTYPQMDIVVSRIRLLYEMSRVMTPEQNEKLRAIFERERREDRGRGQGRNLPRP
jgi:Spy/CpxP family protein refolding chaperone